MRRRPLLRALPAPGGFPLAGCFDRARRAVGLQPEVRTLDTDEKAEMLWMFRDLEADSVTRGEAACAVVVGSSDDSHWVLVAADFVDPVEARIAIRPADGDALYETPVSLSNERYFAVRFEFPQDYAVDVETDRHETTIDVDEDRVDCNHSGTAVLLADEGSVRSAGSTTDMAC